jgi:hypothetical protein
MHDILSKNCLPALLEKSAADLLNENCDPTYFWSNILDSYYNNEWPLC